VEEVGRRPEVTMKFLMIVLAIRFIAELVSNKRKNNNNDANVMNEKIIHPAEFALR
jgi:hypothetical protein